MIYMLDNRSVDIPECLKRVNDKSLNGRARTPETFYKREIIEYFLDIHGKRKYGSDNVARCINATSGLKEGELYYVYPQKKYSKPDGYGYMGCNWEDGSYLKVRETYLSDVIVRKDRFRVIL